MSSVQVTMHGKVSCGEMEETARQTLDHPMTFEALGKELRLFEGWALRDLVNFRRRYRHNLSACFDSYSRALVRCSMGWLGPGVPVLHRWLYQLLSRSRVDLKLKLQVFTHPLDINSRIRREYLKALYTRLNCKLCSANRDPCIPGSNILCGARDKVGAGAR